MHIKIWHAATTAAALMTAPVAASAAPVVLTFDPAGSPGAQMACTNTDGGTVNKFCNHVDFIGVNYGSTAQLGVSYNAGGPETSLRSYDGGFYSGGAYNGSTSNLFSTITFTPTAGNEVSVTSWLYTNGSATAVDYFFEIRDSANNLVASHNANTGGTFAANTAYYTGPLTFLFRNEGGGLVLDNLAVDVRGVATTPPGNGGAVPEPATWAMMLGGFGIIGTAMRRRPRTRVSFS